MTMLTSVMTLADSLRVKRAAILRVGDVGMCHGANRGFLELAERGFVTCGSVMVPCPWFRQIAYGLLPVLPRKIRFAPELAGYDATVAGLDRAGLAVVDGIRGTLPVAAEAVEPGYRKLVDELPAGVTHFALHCAAPGDVEAITPQHASWRTNEYALFASGVVAKWCSTPGVVPIGYRELQRLWCRGTATKAADL